MATVLTVSVIFVGCEKEELVSEKNSSVSNISIEKIYSKNGMLVFPNLETFVEILNEIEHDNNNYIDLFFSKTKGLEHDDIEKLIEQTKWNENQVFENFESMYDYVSLRSKIAKEMIEFNKIYDQTDIKNPDNHYVNNPYIRTLVNTECQVQIGNSIFKYLDNGALIEVLNENLEIANNIDSKNFMDYKLNEEIYVDWDCSCKSADCKMYGGFDWYEVETIYYDNKTIRFCLRCDVDNNSIARNIRGVAKTEYWNGSKWKNYYPYELSVTAGGDVHEGTGCNASEVYQSGTKTKSGDYQVATLASIRFNNKMKAFSFGQGKIGVAATLWLNNTTSYWRWNYYWWE